MLLVFGYFMFVGGLSLNCFRVVVRWIVDLEHSHIAPD